MGYGTNGLTFNALRGANQARLPQFKNKHKKPAHAKVDGSDWNPAQWLQAVVGELGEYARARIEFELGSISFAVYQSRAAKELADVQTYLDILAQRCLDVVDSSLGLDDPAQNLQQLVASLGEYANNRKKFDRGDVTRVELLERTELQAVNSALASLYEDCISTRHTEVICANQKGVDLGKATIEKFNEVSERVGSAVRLDADDWHYASN